MRSRGVVGGSSGSGDTVIRMWYFYVFLPGCGVTFLFSCKILGGLVEGGQCIGNSAVCWIGDCIRKGFEKNWLFDAVCCKAVGFSPIHV